MFSGSASPILEVFARTRAVLLNTPSFSPQGSAIVALEYRSSVLITAFLAQRLVFPLYSVSSMLCVSGAYCAFSGGRFVGVLSFSGFIVGIFVSAIKNWGAPQWQWDNRRQGVRATLYMLSCLISSRRCRLFSLVKTLEQNVYLESFCVSYGHVSLS